MTNYINSLDCFDCFTLELFTSFWVDSQLNSIFAVLLCCVPNDEKIKRRKNTTRNVQYSRKCFLYSIIHFHPKYWNRWESYAFFSLAQTHCKVKHIYFILCIQHNYGYIIRKKNTTNICSLFPILKQTFCWKWKRKLGSQSLTTTTTVKHSTDTCNVMFLTEKLFLIFPTVIHMQTVSRVLIFLYSLSDTYFST